MKAKIEITSGDITGIKAGAIIISHFEGSKELAGDIALRPVNPIFMVVGRIPGRRADEDESLER